MLSHYIAIGLGGATGSIIRVLVGKILPLTIMGMTFYILTVNALGCFLMGLVTELMTLYCAIPDNIKYFLISGVLGGFTTFSAFVLEFSLLCTKHQYLLAIIYASISVVVTITAFFTGLFVVKMLFR